MNSGRSKLVFDLFSSKKSARKPWCRKARISVPIVSSLLLFNTWAGNYPQSLLGKWRESRLSQKGTRFPFHIPPRVPAPCWARLCPREAATVDVDKAEKFLALKNFTSTPTSCSPTVTNTLMTPAVGPAGRRTLQLSAFIFSLKSKARI